MNTVEEVLEGCAVDGLVVRLPDVQLERKLYEGVKQRLEGIGGKWHRKSAGFLFKSDPSNLFGRIQNNEKIDLKKDYQFFETPDAVADKMVELAGVEAHHTILEPSAGRGAIIKAIRRKDPYLPVGYCEIFEGHWKELENVPLTTRFSEDFLQLNEVWQFDRIIANPPFSKGQDYEHIKRMLGHLKPGGRIVTITFGSWRFAQRGAARKLSELIHRRATHVENLPHGTFKESDTNVATTLLVLE